MVYEISRANLNKVLVNLELWTCFIPGPPPATHSIEQVKDLPFLLLSEKKCFFKKNWLYDFVNKLR